MTGGDIVVNKTASYLCARLTTGNGMADYLEQASLYFQNYTTTRENYMSGSNRLHGSADEFARMTLNALFLLNGGGLGVLATLKSGPSGSVPEVALKSAALYFVVGALCALLSSGIAIMNFRAIATKYERLMNAALSRIEELKTKAIGDESPDWKKQAAEADSYGRNVIWGTAAFGWMFGILSFLAFAFGALRMCAVV
jgi:hypothetical protein